MRKKNCVTYLHGGQYGFGHNNNIAVSYIINNFMIMNNDYFLFLNPDVFITSESLINYVDYIISNDYKFSTLCLYRDFTKSKHDYSIRSFPTLYDFLCSFLLGVNKSKIKKENILSDTVVDWCAGSFMLIHALSFLNVNGFDQKYFMYCEDIDLCMRLKLSGVDLYYTPHFDAIHYAQHENRRIFTKAFRWHIRSITRYILRKPILSYKNYRKITSELVK